MSIARLRLHASCERTKEEQPPALRPRRKTHHNRESHAANVVKVVTKIILKLPIVSSRLVYTEKSRAEKDVVLPSMFWICMKSMMVASRYTGRKGASVVWSADMYLDVLYSRKLWDVKTKKCLLWPRWYAAAPEMDQKLLTKHCLHDPYQAIPGRTLETYIRPWLSKQSDKLVHNAAIRTTALLRSGWNPCVWSYVYSTYAGFSFTLWKV